MLDWLKNILGDNYNEEVDKKVSEQIGKEFVSRADFNTTNETKKQLEKDIKARDKQLEELKKSDPEGLKAEIEKLQEENKTSTEKLEEQLKKTKLDYKLETLLMKEGAVNTKAVKALLDSEKISLDGDNLIGVDDQLKALKESEKWAFNQAPTVITGKPQRVSPEKLSAVEERFYQKNPDLKPQG